MNAVEAAMSVRAEKEYRDRIAYQVARLKPSRLLLLGDQVSDGQDMEQWRFFDEITKPIRDAEIRTFAIRGDGDYGSPDHRISTHEFNARWPDAAWREPSQKFPEDQNHRERDSMRGGAGPEIQTRGGRSLQAGAGRIGANGMTTPDDEQTGSESVVWP